MGAQWARIRDLPEDLGRYIGPMTRAGEDVTEDFVNASDVRHRAETQAGEDVTAIRGALRRWADQGFAHWADFELADAWFRRAMELTDAAHEREVDALPYMQQRARVREALEALMQGYRALDLPCVTDPELRTVVERDYGGPQVSPCDTKRWATWARDHGAYLFQGGAWCVIVRERYRFVADSTVRDMGFANECEADGTPKDDDWERVYGLKNGRWSWDSWAFADNCLHRGGFLQTGACEDAVSYLLPLLKLYWNWCREISRACVRRGPARVLVESVRYALLRNAREAQRLGVLTSPRASAGAEAAVAGLVGLAAIDLAHAQDGGEFFSRPVQGAPGNATPDEMMGAVAGAATLVGGPGAGLALGILYGVARLLVGWLPAAVAHNYDVFGRDQPVFERNFLTSDPTVAPTDAEPRRGAPTHDVPEPPGFVRTGNVSDGQTILTDQERRDKARELERGFRVGGMGFAGGDTVVDESTTRRGEKRMDPRGGRGVDGWTTGPVVESVRLRDIEAWIARGLIVVYRGGFPVTDGQTWRRSGFGLPAPRESSGAGAAEGITAGLALGLALLAAVASSGGRE